MLKKSFLHVSLQVFPLTRSTSGEEPFVVVQPFSVSSLHGALFSQHSTSEHLTIIPPTTIHTSSNVSNN